MTSPHQKRLARLLALSLALGLAGPAFVPGLSSSARAAGPAPAFEVQEATIADIHAAILSGNLTATRLVGLYLARIKAYNGHPVAYPEGLLGPVTLLPEPGVNAVITLNLRPAARRAWGFDERKARSLTDAADADPAMPDALETAARLDAEFAGAENFPAHSTAS